MGNLWASPTAQSNVVEPPPAAEAPPSSGNDVGPPPLSPPKEQKQGTLQLGGGYAAETASLMLLEMGFEYRRVGSGGCHDQKRDGADGPPPPSFKCTERLFPNGCAATTRLFHVESGTMITGRNRYQFIPDGQAFDKISSLCQKISQDRIVREYSLERITVCDGDPGIGGEPPIFALVDRGCDGNFELDDCSESSEPTANHQTQQRQRPVLVIITGKGKSRAGIISIKELVHSGYESGSAALHLEEARRRGMRTIILDPNARGVSKGMDTVDRSLSHFFSSPGFWNGSDCGGGPVYVLAHSAAGGFLVRHLILGDRDRERKGLLANHLRAIVFSDSTHNIQWARNDGYGGDDGAGGIVLFDFLQSARCLYIRNNAVRPSEFRSNDDYEPGERADVDEFWKRRFGDIPTVWAGTSEHSLVCAVAHGVIWRHFDGQRHLEGSKRLDRPMRSGDVEQHCQSFALPPVPLRSK